MLLILETFAKERSYCCTAVHTFYFHPDNYSYLDLTYDTRRKGHPRERRPVAVLSVVCVCEWGGVYTLLCELTRCSEVLVSSLQNKTAANNAMKPAPLVPAAALPHK